jgi:hypothetical protein
MLEVDPFRITSPFIGDFGGLHFPLDTTQFESSFVSLDPARSRLAALFASAIRSELAPVWKKIVGTASPLFDRQPVETVFELDPVTHLAKQVNLKTPILALHRVEEQVWSEHTMQVDKCEQDWNLHYILPNLDVGDTRRISDLLRIIPEIIRRVIRARGHHSYDDGTLQFFADKGGIGSIKLSSVQSGQARFGGQVESPVWLATTCLLHTVEYGSDSEEEFEPFDSVDWNIGVGDSTGIIPNFIEAYSEVL